MSINRESDNSRRFETLDGYHKRKRRVNLEAAASGFMALMALAGDCANNNLLMYGAGKAAVGLIGVVLLEARGTKNRLSLFD